MAASQSFHLEKTYLCLEQGPAALPLEVGPDFWQTVAERPELKNGARLVAVFAFDANWSGWEMHPAGDEVVVLLSGAFDLIFEDAGAERRVPLREGACCVVPRGVWHTVDVHEPSRALHITPGEDTQHRPR